VLTNLNTGMHFLYPSKIALLFICCLASFTLSAAVVHSGDSDLAIGDFAQIFLPGLGLGMALYQGDDEGVQQWWKSTGSTVLATQILKQTFANSSIGTRPNGSAKSFPSGHTAGACSGAAFLNTRYGWEYGGPSYVLAAFVGYTRVDEQQHHWRDVLAGCALGVGFNYQFVTPRNIESRLDLSLSDQGVPMLSYRMRY
jgi:membrane-associated phospholipid phosphatase